MFTSCFQSRHFARFACRHLSGRQPPAPVASGLSLLLLLISSAPRPVVSTGQHGARARHRASVAAFPRSAAALRYSFATSKLSIAGGVRVAAALCLQNCARKGCLQTEQRWRCSRQRCSGAERRKRRRAAEKRFATICKSGAQPGEARGAGRCYEGRMNGKAVSVVGISTSAVQWLFDTLCASLLNRPTGHTRYLCRRHVCTPFLCLQHAHKRYGAGSSKQLSDAPPWTLCPALLNVKH